MRVIFRLTATLVALFSTPLLAGALLIPKDAPEWRVEEWINRDPGTVADQRGKVVLIEFFQMWCPSCNSFSQPLFERWEYLYGDRDDVEIVSIHTVFEGHDVQSPERLKDFVKAFGIKRPVGIDKHDSRGNPVPATMRRFETEGTPQVAIVDKFGVLRWSHFGRFDPKPVEHLIDRMLLEKDGDAVESEEAPKASSSRSSRKASSSRGRSTPPSRSSRTPAPSRGGPADGGKDERLSGKYRVSLQQTSKSCGELLPPQTVFADVTVLEEGGEMTVKFSRRYLEQQEIKLSYAGGSFESEASTEAQERGIDVGMQLTVSGTFVDESEPPQMEFEFQLDKTSADGSQDCVITGTGSAGKAGA